MPGKADIGPKIGIEGEKQFRDEIKAINTGLKTLGSEMKLVTSEFIGNENSVEALTAKNDVLDRTISTLNERLEVQQRLLESSANAFGEADARTQRLQQAVNSTQAAINEANSKIRQNSQLISANSGEAKSLSDVLKSSLTSGLEKLGDKLGLSSSQVSTLTSGFSGLSSGSLAAAGALGIFAAAVAKLTAELVTLAREGGKHADEVATLATNYNLAAKDVQRFQYMAELTDVSVETMTGSISRLTRSMDSARSGSGEAAAAFAQLGVSVANGDGSLRSANEVFMEAIDALGRVGNETERDALAMAIFGKSAMELNSVIKLGSEGLAEYAAEADSSAYVMSDKMLSALQGVDDATQRLDKSNEALKNTLAAAVAPAVQFGTECLAFYETALANALQTMLGMKDTADETASSIDALTDSIKASGDALASIRDSTPEDFWTKEQKAFKEYVEAASRWSAETGQTATVYAPGAHYQTREEYLQTRQPQPIDITLEIDGRTLARTTYDEFQSEGTRRGGRAFS